MEAGPGALIPRALSSNLCSLLPDVTRLCLAVHAELDARGAVKRSRVVRGFMRSAAKLTYGGVARALGFTSEPPRQPKAEEMVDGLRVAHEVSRILRSRRLNRGALDFVDKLTVGEREAIEWAEAIPLETAAELKAFG